MLKDCSNPIEIIGISKVFPSCSKTFKQFQVQEMLCIPDEKPDIEQILSINISSEIIHKYVIATPKSVSWECQTLTGNKLFIRGVLKEIIEYIADNEVQSVHTVHYDIPFTAYVILEEQFQCNSDISVESYIEDVYVRKLGKRKIFKNVMLLVNASTTVNY